MCYLRKVRGGTGSTISPQMDGEMDGTRITTSVGSHLVDASMLR